METRGLTIRQLQMPALASPSATPSSNVSPAPAPSTSAEPFPNSIATLGRFATNSGFPNAFPGAADWVQGYLSRGENARNGSPTLRMANPQESRNGSYSVPSAVNPVARPPATSAGSQAQRTGDSPKSVQDVRLQRPLVRKRNGTAIALRVFRNVQRILVALDSQVSCRWRSSPC